VAEIRPVVRLMIDYLARKEILHDAFFKKYAAKKYMKASIIVREWIRSEYTEEEFNSIPVEVEESKEMDEEEDQENTPDEEERNENSDVDDYMYANELEDHEVDE